MWSSSYRDHIITVLLFVCAVVLLLLDAHQGVLFRVRMVIGFVVLLCLPGWWIAKRLLDDERHDQLEIAGLSIALSLGLVPLVTYYLLLLGFVMSPLLVVGTAGCITLVGMIGFFYKSHKRSRVS